MLDSLKNFYRKELFQPGFLALFFNPYYFIRAGLYRNIKLLSKELTGDIVDFGCGSMPYRELFQVNSYTGIDFKESGHDHQGEEGKIFYDGHKLPLQSNSIDGVFASEVFEHVFNLEDILKEFHRVLKNGGKMLITVPFVWEEHEIPYDYARYSSFGLKHLLTQNGFIVRESIKSGESVQTIFQLLNAFLYGLFPKFKPIKLLLTFIIISPLNILAFLLKMVLPKNDNLYLNNIILVEKVM